MMRGSNPFGDIESMFERMSRQFEEMNRQFDSWSGSQSVASGISIDVADHDDEIVVTADVPGFEKDDIDISLSEQTLTIRAEREMEHEQESGEYLRRERGHASVHRSIRLPVEVDADATRASYSNGVLTVTLPKVAFEEREESHRIDIE